MDDPAGVVASAFPALDEANLRLLLAAGEAISRPGGADLFREGDASDGLYVLQTGTLEVLVTDAGGREQSLARLHPGELVGEMGLLYSAPRAATVRAVEDATLLKFSRSRLEPLLAHAPLRVALTEAASRRLPSLYLSTVPMFAGLDADALQELDLRANWVRVAGGESLFHEGDAADYLYVLARGRLEVLVRSAAGGIEVTGQLGRGAVVGEVALLTGQPRTATIRAIRDSDLIRLSEGALRQLLARYPNGAFEMLRALAHRVRPAASPPRATLVTTIALVPVGSHSPPPAWTDRLAEALGTVGGATLHVTPDAIDRALGEGTVAALGDDRSRQRIAAWLRSREDHYRYVVFDCGGVPSPWAELCLRQADLVLLIAAAEGEPVASELQPHLFPASGTERSVAAELVLLHPETTARPQGTARWLRAFPVARHHHIRLDRTEDHFRVARAIAGKCVTAVFSGGGARALGHIGVVRALQESGIPIDAVAGVSAGCFAPAFYAMGHDTSAMVAIANESVGSYSALREATFPILSFLSGHGSVKMLRGMFDVEIEDLWVPFFCLSSNLTRAELVVHDRGSLWQAIRASTSVPGVSPPVCVGGDLLVDGGLINNLPGDVMRERHGGTVIAVDVSQTVELTTSAGDVTAVSGWPLAWKRFRPFGKTAKPALPHVFEILLRSVTLSSMHHGSTVARAADLYMRLPVAGVATLDWKAGPALVERCYRYALDEIRTWKNSGLQP